MADFGENEKSRVFTLPLNSHIIIQHFLIDLENIAAYSKIVYQLKYVKTLFYNIVQLSAILNARFFINNKSLLSIFSGESLTEI